MWSSDGQWFRAHQWDMVIVGKCSVVDLGSSGFHLCIMKLGIVWCLWEWFGNSYSMLVVYLRGGKFVQESVNHAVSMRNLQNELGNPDHGFELNSCRGHVHSLQCNKSTSACGACGKNSSRRSAASTAYFEISCSCICRSVLGWPAWTDKSCCLK